MISVSDIDNAYNSISLPKTKNKLAAYLKTRYYLISDNCTHLVFDNKPFKGKYLTEDILNGLHPEYQTLKLKKRLILEGYLENKCSICFISEWNSKPISLQLDHINGNNKDHSLRNLRILCPNCHSQTDTYAGRNKVK